MAAKKRNKKQTLREFRAWLEGVEELQPEGWAPNREQWKLIRARIDGIIEEKIERKVSERPAVPQSAPPVVNNTPEPRAVVAGLPPPAPLPPSGVPIGEAAMTPEAKQLLQPGAAGKIKTPDIDTSDGKVESPFA